MRLFARLLENARTRALLSVVAVLLLACKEPVTIQGPAEVDASDEDLADILAEDAPHQPTLKDIGPNGRRAKVIVLPGDAAVEVEGLVVRRRDGIVELTGEAGQVSLLRVFKGERSIERHVTIEEDAGASPPLIDLDEQPVRAARPQRKAGARAAGVHSLLDE